MRIPILCLFFLIASCSRDPASPLTSASVRCVAFGGFEAKVCPVSMLALVANPDIYNDKVVAIQGVVADLGGTTFILPNSQFVADRDSASAVVCRSSATWSCSKLIGQRATLIGTFSTNYADDNLFIPAGSITLLHVRDAKAALPPQGSER